jgi:hypothetical protein
MKIYHPKSDKKVSVEIIINMEINADSVTDDDGEDCTPSNLLSCVEKEIMDLIENTLDDDDRNPVYKNFTVCARRIGKNQE